MDSVDVSVEHYEFKNEECGDISTVDSFEVWIAQTFIEGPSGKTIARLEVDGKTGEITFTVETPGCCEQKRLYYDPVKDLWKEKTK